jgi:MFS family permease
MPDGAEATPDPRRWLALLTCCSALFMTLLDVSVTNVALPSIGHATSATPSQLQVGGQRVHVRLRPGAGPGRPARRRPRPAGSFTATSLLAGLAPSPEILIGARALQRWPAV